MEKINLLNTVLKEINSGILVIKNNTEIEIINEEAKASIEIMEILYDNLPDGFKEIASIRENLERVEVRTFDKVFGLSSTYIEDGINYYTIIIFKEITAIKKREDFEKRNERFITLGEMIVSLSHEIRNPLNLIRGFSQLVLESDDIEFIKENVRMVISEADRLNKLAENMLGYTKREKINLISFDLVQFIKELIMNLGLENIIDFTYNMDTIIIEADKDKIMQIFLNIIKNAIDAFKTENEKIFNIKVFQNIDKVSIIFENNGQIQNDIQLEKIFLPFFTTKSDGTGLGLAITKKIIDEHNGEIMAYRNIYNGLSFKIILPLKSKLIL